MNRLIAALLLCLPLAPCARCDDPCSGTVAQVYVSAKGNVFLNFGGRYPGHESAGFVAARYVPACGGVESLRKLEGASIRITGEIKIYKGKPEIAVKSASQIQKSP